MALLKYNRKLKAFSLVESLVTMVLVLVIFFIMIHFFVSLNQSGFNLQRMKAASILNEYVQASSEARSFTTKKETVDGWLVTREALPYPASAALEQVQFTIYKKDSLGTPLLTRTLLVNTKTITDTANAQP
ncbi:MAG: hypothetical protein J7539_17950 [Niabella sp.]|nr:hypothetical protein [Niabella sp.]